MSSILSISGVSKTFMSTKALDDLTMTVEPSEVHALVGHNGSGKSTLIKILSGFHEPDAGSGPFVVDGQTIPYGDSDACHRAGLRFIHQELGLLDDLSVLENLRLGDSYETAPGWRIRWRNERRRAREILSIVGLDLNPEILVETLTPIERTQVAVARALQSESAVRVLVLDEPTATLPSSEVDRLFELIRRTTAHGVGIIYVSHRLEEIHAISNRVTVLREGKIVGTGPSSEFDNDRLVELIVGSVAEESAPLAAREATRVREAGEVLAFDGITAGELVDASFAVRSGEIVGMAGLAGSGVHDVPAVLLGSLDVEGGTVRVHGEVIDRPEPEELRDRGVAVLPSARDLKGIAEMSIRENLTLSDLKPLTRGIRLDLAGEKREVRSLIKRFDIKPAEAEKPLGELSGGNKQKVAVAKWLRVDPDLLVLDEPTQGVDVGAKAEILDLVSDAASQGVAAVLCSSDLDDLAAICSRVLIIRGGSIAAELTGAQITREAITEECYRSSEPVSA